MTLFRGVIIFVSMISFFGCAVLIEERAPETSGPEKGGKVAICHKDKKTIYVDESAVKGHLGHGDYMGRCR